MLRGYLLYYNSRKLKIRRKLKKKIGQSEIVHTRKAIKKGFDTAAVEAASVGCIPSFINICTTL